MRSRISAPTVAMTMLATLIVMLHAGGTFAADARAAMPSAVKGTLDASSWDFTRDGAIPLNGEWEFYWEKLIGPSEFAAGKAGAMSGYIRVPGKWNGYDAGAGKIGNTGYATFRLVVKTGARDRMLALKTYDLGTAFRIFVDGRESYTNGAVGTGADSSVPRFLPGMAVFRAAGGTVEVVVQVSNYHHRDGGFWYSIELGDEPAVRDAHMKGIASDTLLGGVLLIMGIYFIVLYMLHARDRSALYFGAMCLVMAVRTFVVGERVLVMFQPWMPYELVSKLDYSCVILGTVFFTFFMNEFFPGEFRRGVKHCYAGLSGLYLLTVLAFGAARYSVLMPYYQIFILAILVYCTAVLVLATIRGRANALIMLLGWFFVFAATVNDILYENMVLYTGRFFALGVFLFLVMSMAGISRRFISREREAELGKDRASREAQENRAQAEFIRGVIRESSSAVSVSMREMDGELVRMQDNTGDQAAAVEEVTASVEEISAGSDRVAQGADEQDRSMGTLASLMDELEGIITDTAGLIKRALAAAADISAGAKAGGDSLGIMSESMRRVNESSRQMNEIVSIINDISDRINLLALNAAIEAARAGDAGRGFAVVADEIGKLADQTASSIKDITALIRANESEIAGGSSGVGKAVEIIGGIIGSIRSVTESVDAVSGNADKQLVSYRRVRDYVGTVQDRSRQIMNAMQEQKNALGDVSSSLASINRLSQENAEGILAVSEASKKLLSMIDTLDVEIKSYEGKMA
jgi:methyl-accepting chemotaxis protein